MTGDRTNDSLDSELCSNHSLAIKQQQHQSAPQLKFAEDGSIIINEESLIIQRVEVEPHYDSTVVEESENLDNLNYNSYRKFHHTKKWSKRGVFINLFIKKRLIINLYFHIKKQQNFIKH